MFSTNPAYSMNNMVPFRSGYVFGATLSPPSKPPTMPNLALGLYCIKATCELRDSNNVTVGEFSGYDTSLSIAKKVEGVCELKRSGVNRERCTSSEVTFLQPSATVQCSGEVYFVVDNKVRKVV
jgi:hypothetical protein